MKKANILTLLLLISLTIASFAQQGKIRGTVLDMATGEPLIGVAAFVQGTTTGTISDFDGKFEVGTAPGTYSLQLSYMGYANVILEGIEVTANKVTLLNNIPLQESAEQLGEVVVTAEMLNNTEEALLTVKRKAPNLLDGISSANFRRMGDSDAAEAIRRVPGVSLEGGKYVYVRGLGDRYTKSTLNGMEIPGLDPDRNTIQMDMFPTSLLDNIIVLKSFTADLPADFTAGIVEINTKDFPEEKTFSVSLSTGYHPNMHFNNNYLTYKGGKTDYLGFDDGTRRIPIERGADVPQYASVVGRPDSPKGQQFKRNLGGFNPTLAAMRERSMMNIGLGFNFGNQLTSGKNTIGYNFSLVYKNETEFYAGAEYGRYGKGNPGKTELEEREYQRGDLGINNVSLSGLAGVALKRARAKYRLNLFHSQNGSSRAGIFKYQNSDLGANFTADQHNLEYSQRSITNLLLNGVHYNSDGSWEIGWSVSPTRSRIVDPDIRYTRIRTDGGNYSIGSESGYPERIWRFLEEDNLAGKVDATKVYSLFDRNAKFKFGGAHSFKLRNYEIQNFQIIPQGVAVNGDPDQLFRAENLWPTNDKGTLGTRYEAMFLPHNPNQFEANSNNIGLYISNEFDPTERLKVILGLRAENYVQHYSGSNQQGLTLTNEKVLGDLDLFPSANLVYTLLGNQNLRFSYSKTVARPSFKEASFAEILDPLSGRTFIGGFFPDVNSDGEVIWDGRLKATHINNLDLRWELFQKGGQTLALSGFYKNFDNPIEIVQYVQAPNNFQARNVGDGEVMGIEFEIRQSLATVAKGLENFSINGNFTLTESRIAMSPTEFQSRAKNERVGEHVGNKRDMAGQAPYLINAGLSYNGRTNGLEAGIYYNVQGETLQYVGIADKPDVYSLPFHSLNFNAGKSLGTADRMRLGLGISNLLSSKRETVFQSFEAQNQLFEVLNPGTNIDVSFGYSF